MGNPGRTKTAGELMKIKHEIQNRGHAIAQALFGPPMLEAEAKNRQGARTDITKQIPESDRGEAREKAAAIMGTNERGEQ